MSEIQKYLKDDCLPALLLAGEQVSPIQLYKYKVIVASYHQVTRETEEQNMKVAQNPLAHTTLYTLKLSKKWFIEFMEDEHPEIDAQVELFAPDSHDQDHVLLKEHYC
ncbi:uncharacterized protein FFB20_13432 [Fusarium fujikuroi]|uniref:Uncharacterized protein n=1 Tax=Gibberella fujikuroi (strain CBS 195.34 / IMI 58289 / NRRL A-6831) TaxID=1279085 RepID=S0DMA5_GIBF5|nr:uncharacterized protein FFUJ_01834 [Fusarium fujikuroi IMI 58289]KLO97636.1 uncharacterized protein Y057_2679 [Fusarium fujikuroi]KLP21856.1 uncharacterized protein LW94_6725 [Fusarium fujikuroi]CCT61688.1 uncharacterized protein FFUJ_01834 [Fusarium fujikuroi IMI 58289]SCN74091.1 uncharacterized protein FFC1_01961 [Fusarium fujikuroi]SCO08395.1 uncharacterized protein FFE2_11533 [Fusarium fujikuroi]